MSEDNEEYEENEPQEEYEGSALDDYMIKQKKLELLDRMLKDLDKEENMTDFLLSISESPEAVKVTEDLFNAIQVLIRGLAHSFTLEAKRDGDQIEFSLEFFDKKGKTILNKFIEEEKD